MTLGPLMVDVAGITLTAEDREVLGHPLVGGVILFTRNFSSLDQLASLVNEIGAVRKPPLLIAVDHEGGRVQRFRKDFTVLPAIRVIGQQYAIDPLAAKSFARECGWLMAAECLSVGIDISFAPIVDLDYGVSTVIGDRAFHRDARIVAELAIAYMHGMRDAGMASTAKHFPGHGAVVADSHVALPIDRRPRADMVDDLYPYGRLIENGLPAAMMAHVVYEAVDDRPASFSPYWIGRELRGELGFAGAIFSDDLNMEGASVMGGVAARVRAALDAGCDMTPVCNNRPGVLETLEKLHWDPDPVSQVRLARMRGRNAVSRQDLRASDRWLAATKAIVSSAQPPELRLA
jgi:beta-N-acetylhexosaminidase